MYLILKDGECMKKNIITLIMVLFVCSIVVADPVVGYWKSIDDKTGKVTAGWEIYEKDGELYGKILSLVGFPVDQKASNCDTSYKGFPLSGNVSEMTVIGTPWIFGLEKKSTGKWSGGSIIDPESGNMYACEVTFHAAGKKYDVDTLEMRGKVGPFGKSQFWEKATFSEIKVISQN